MTPTENIIPGFDIRDELVYYAKNQPEYITLPAWRNDEGMVVTRWNLTWKERFLVLLQGSIWLTLLTFNKPLQPVKLTTQCPLMGSAMLDKEI